MIQATAIVPTYLRPEETARCLQRLAESRFLQTEFCLETIVVDSSPDELTWEAIKGLRRDLNLRYIKLPKQTYPSDARNLAIQEASSELIISVDSDVEVQPATVWSTINYLRDHPRVARMTGRTIVSCEPDRGKVDYPKRGHAMFQDRDTVFTEAVLGRYEALYRSAFLSTSGYDPIFEARGEGLDLSFQFWRAGLPLGYSGEITAYHNLDAPYGLVRAHPERLLQRYRSLYLLAYKYDVEDVASSPNFVKACEKRLRALGGVTFHSIVCAARSLEWLAENHPAIVRSKERAPRTFDFKPFEVFSDQGLLAACLRQAEDRIRPFHQAVFHRLGPKAATRPHGALAPIPIGVGDSAPQFTQ